MRFDWMVDFGDVSIRFDLIRSLKRGVDGTTISCDYGRDGEETTMPYRDALKLYEEVRAKAAADYEQHMLKLAAVQRVV